MDWRPKISNDDAAPSRESGAKRLAQTILLLLGLIGIGLDLVAILAAAFPGSSGEWAGLGVAIPATLAVIIGLVMIPLVFTQRKDSRRKYAAITAAVILLPLLAVGVSRLRSYWREVFIYRPMIEKMTPELKPAPSVQSPSVLPPSDRRGADTTPQRPDVLPLPTLSPQPSAPAPAALQPPNAQSQCVNENDPDYPVSVATMQLISVRDRRQYWEGRLQQDAQLRSQYAGGYDQMLAAAVEKYHAAGGTETNVLAVRLRLFPCYQTIGSIQVPTVPPPGRNPQRSGAPGQSAVSATRTISQPADTEQLK